MTKRPIESRIMVGVTGASGAVWAEILIRELLKSVERVYLVATDTAKKVIHHELSYQTSVFSLRSAIDGEINSEFREKIRVFSNDDFFAPIASGSASATGMVIVPCSMGTLGRIAHGVSTTLIERAADVVLKQRGDLILCPRETPLNRLHLQNMLSLHDAGAIVLPPVPAFYTLPQHIDDINHFIVGKILESLKIQHTLYRPWNARMV